MLKNSICSLSFLKHSITFEISFSTIQYETKLGNYLFLIMELSSVLTVILL